MYHIICDLEKKFADINVCRQWLSELVLAPTVPTRRMLDEDQNTPRICVAETIADCITGIGAATIFARCCAKNIGLYNNVNEVYPLAVLELRSDLPYVMPSEEDVPDVAVTNEKWLLTSTKPVKNYILWLRSDSVGYHRIKYCGDVYIICDTFRPLSDPTGYDHPWLNGKGHPLYSLDR